MTTERAPVGANKNCENMNKLLAKLGDAINISKYETHSVKNLIADSMYEKWEEEETHAKPEENSPLTANQPHTASLTHAHLHSQDQYFGQ